MTVFRVYSCTYVVTSRIQRANTGQALFVSKVPYVLECAHVQVSVSKYGIAN